MLAYSRALSTSCVKSQIVSAIQPTGKPHLGNYLGALRHWIALQDTNRGCIFGIADNHVLTSRISPGDVQSNTRTQVAVLLALGLNVSQSILYKHSTVPQHTALAWLLSTAATSGFVQRLRTMPQYKEKSQRHDNLALLTYPVLMSADILLFHGTHVPVGEDQNIHIEFCNAMATNFNRIYKCSVFNPVNKLLTEAPRVKSLADPGVKMSKSYGKAVGVIEMMDSDDVIRRKVKKAVTDSLGPITRDNTEQRPGVQNLMHLLSVVSGEDMELVEGRFEGGNVLDLKMELAEVLVDTIRPVRTRAMELLDDHVTIDSVLESGTERASDIAERNLIEIHRIVGLR